MEQTKQKTSFFVQVATWIVDKRNLFFLVYAAAIIFSLFSQGWVSVDNDITDYLPADTETRQGLRIMEDQFVTLGTARVMVSNISYEQALPLADALAAIDGIASVDFGSEDDAEARMDHYRDSAALYDVTFDGEADDPTSLAAMKELKRTMPCREAMIETLNLAFPTVLTSGAILACAGTLIAKLTSDAAIYGVGDCLGRGTIISMFLVMGVLPEILLLGDTIIEKTAFNIKHPALIQTTSASGKVYLDGMVKGVISGKIDAEIHGVLEGDVTAVVNIHRESPVRQEKEENPDENA